MARFATAAQLERLVRGYRRAVSLESAEAAHRDRFLSCEWEEDGSLRIRGRLAPEDGALFLQGDRGGRRRDSRARRGRRRRGPRRFRGTGTLARVNDADALMEVAEGALAGGFRPPPCRRAPPGDRPCRGRGSCGRRGGPGCRIDDGPAICAESARRLACDASLVPSSMVEGACSTSAERHGRSRASMRSAIDARDEGRCQFPGCENRRWVDAHHIVHWARGGQTKIDNLVLLCSRHHRLVHEGGFGVARAAEGSLIFRRPDGRPVPGRSLPRVAAADAELRAHNRRAKLPIDPDSAMPLGRGEPFDRELAVSGLLARAGP